MKKIKNPLIRRIPKELIGDWKKYLVVFLFLVLTIGFVSGMYVANESMITSANEGVTKYKQEDGHFELKKQADATLLSAIETGEKADVKQYYLDEAKKKLDKKLPKKFKEKFDEKFPDKFKKEFDKKFPEQFKKSFDKEFKKQFEQSFPAKFASSFKKCNLLEYLTQRDIQTKNSGVNVRYRGKHRFFKGFNEFIKEKTRRCDNDFEKIERHVFF